MFRIFRHVPLAVAFLVLYTSVLAQKKGDTPQNDQLSVSELRSRLLQISSSAGDEFKAITNGNVKRNGFYFGNGTFSLLDGKQSYIHRSSSALYFAYITENASRQKSIDEYERWKELTAKALPEYDLMDASYEDVNRYYYYPWDSKNAFIELKRIKGRSGWNVSLGVVEPGESNYENFTAEKIKSLKDSSDKPTVVDKLIASDGTIHPLEGFTGTGRYLESSGLWYNGQFEKGDYSGFGKMVIPGGGVYKGFLKANKFSGRGFLVFTKNNNWYEGDFLNGKANGKGTKMTYSEKGWMKYTGEFKDGEYSGEGVLRDQTNNRIIGTFSKGEPVPGKYRAVRWSD